MLPSRPLVAFLLFLFYVSALTLSPYQFSADSGWRASFFSLQDVDAADIILNIIGFSVFGIILFWLRPGKDKTSFNLCVAVGCAFTLSAIIESLQVYLPERDTQLMDVLSNTIGGGIGFLMASYVHHNSWHLKLAPLKKTLAIIGFLLYVTGIIAVVIVTAMPQRLDSWDPSFPFLLGNEATQDRPWLGAISSLMIFDRVLDQKEISSIFTIGRLPKTAFERKYQPILAYQFDEGKGNTVHDQSQFGEPVNMHIRYLDQTAWLPGGGLRLQEPTVLQSVRSGKKLFRRITDTDTFSVSMWLQPTSLEQYGPARIVSFSKSTLARNFTIGQQGENIHFRIRDRLSGSNGVRWELKVPYALRTTIQPINGVFVYEKGIKRVYIDGEKVREVYPPDWLTFIAWFLHFDSDLPWQRWMLISLLVGGAGILLWPLAISRRIERKRI